ncbi:MAG: addiction module toxin RelE, partial [Chromatiaceae bacterium]
MIPYVVLNPVRAGMVDAPEQWPWSSHRAMIGEAPPPTWPAVDGLLGQFGPSRAEARRWYRSFVHEGVGETIW